MRNIALMYERSNANWIVDQCAGSGKITLGREKINDVFGTGDKLWENIYRFCSQNKLSLTFDSGERLFTFEAMKE
jgi:hypothetical protein